MSDSRWKDALWKLLDTLPLRRMTARVALSAGLLGLAAQSPADAGPRVPVLPALEPEAAVRKFRGRYVLRRVANSITVRLAGHRSHSSHASHASHASHSSSSHYSGAHSSHFSSSPAPSPAPVPPPEPSLPRSVAPPSPAPLPKPAPILLEGFDSEPAANRWRIGVLATPPETFEPHVALEQSDGVLTVTPPGHTSGTHFSGYVSRHPFDLNTVSIAVQIRHAASGATTIFAAAIDAANWIGFRIEGGQLAMESHTNGRVAAKKIPYSATQHRFFRLRTSSVAPVVAWETSSDGRNWNPEYVETATINCSAVRIALSAGTTRAAAAGSAAFDNVIVEKKP